MSISVITVVSLGMVGGMAPAHAAGLVELPAGCTPVQVLVFRGSGEPRGSAGTYRDTTMTTNGWEGKTLRRLLEAYVAQSRGTSAPNPYVDTVPVKAIGPDEFGTGKGYPGVAVPRTVDVTFIKKVIGDSARAGATNTASYIDSTIQAQTAAGCPSPKFVVLGYSQGAITARWLTQLRPDDVALTQIFGDPLQFENQTGNHGSGSGGNGFMRYISTTPEKIQDNKYYALSSSKTGLCHGGDPFCDYNWLVGAFAIVFHQFQEHLDYVTGNSEITQEGQTISRKVAQLIQTVTVNGPTLGRQKATPEHNYLDDIDMNTLMADPNVTVANPETPQANLSPLQLQAIGKNKAAHLNLHRFISIREGSTVRIHVAGIPAGQQFGLRLTSLTSKGSWRLPAVWTSPIYTSTGGTQTITPALTGIDHGSYTASVLTNTFTHTPDTTITITQ